MKTREKRRKREKNGGWNLGKIFFTSDLHFGHKNVIGFDQRPYFTVEEMDKSLIENWNNKVKPGDTVYVLGDMFWFSDNNYVQNILKALNGQIILIKGNHEKWLHNAANKKLLAGIKDFDDITVTLNDGTTKRCILSHYYMPFYKNHYHGAIHLHSHTHSSPESILETQISKYLNENGCPCSIHNVGCMHWNYEPVTLDEILNR